MVERQVAGDGEDKRLRHRIVDRGPRPETLREPRAQPGLVRLQKNGKPAGDLGVGRGTRGMLAASRSAQVLIRRDQGARRMKRPATVFQESLVFLPVKRSVKRVPSALSHFEVKFQ